jgi:L-alanine-DL-glutamate epimerase-like enolase superfamily enzyme
VSEIVGIDITHHQLPLDPPFPAAWDPSPRTRFPATIVRVRDSEGRVGIGSGDAMVGFAPYARWFIGEDPLALDQHAARLANIDFHAGRPWPLDVALWDLAGKIRGQPVWRMLGGTSPAVRLYASMGVHRNEGESVSSAQRLVSQGFAAVKLRFGRRRLDDDLAVVSAVRRALGDSIALMVDCNQGWRMPWDTARPWDLSIAWPVAQRLSDLGVCWMEEPLHRGDYAGMAELRARVKALGPLRIAGGEMTREPYEFRELLRQGCLDVYQPDVVCTQGFSGLAPIARDVIAAGRWFTPHTWGNGIGVLANIHLAAGVAGPEGATWVEWPLDPPEWTTERRDYVLAGPLRASDGWFRLSEEPGLGVLLDESLLARTANDPFTAQLFC